MQDIDDPLAPFARLIAVMARLRDPEQGCPWDREQDFRSIAPFTIEEAYEVADAIERHDMAGLRDELGDLLLQVVFHARMAEEAGHFGLADVARAIVAKMERRHPHIFANDGEPVTPAIVRARWEQIKALEKPRQSALDDIARALPALVRAQKIAARAARAGFDWPDAEGPRAKIDEELAELAGAASDDARADEAGDLLFSVAVYLRHLGVDAEQALRRANAKFERRFRAIEAMEGFAESDLSGKDTLWQAVKAAERNPAASRPVGGQNPVLPGPAFPSADAMEDR